MSAHILVENIGDVTVATFTDAELVSEEVLAAVGEQLMGLAEGPALAKVVLNFREVRSMSSTMLAVLFKFSRRVETSGGRLKLCGINADLKEIFRITRFDRLFEIYPNDWAALDAFESSSSAEARG